MKKRYLFYMASSFLCLLLAVLWFGRKQWEERPFIMKNNIEEKTELTIVFAGRNITWDGVMDSVIAGFEKERSDISIRKKTDEPNVLYETYLRQLASTGQMGDIVEISNIDYFRYGYMAVLPAELAELSEKRYEQDGNIYGLSCGISTVGIIYNKKIFRQLGIELPKTFEEFLKLCEKIKTKGYQPIIAGGGDLWYMEYWLNQFFLNDVLLKEPRWEEMLMKGEASWKDECIKNMFLHLYEVFHSGVQEDWQTDKYSQMPMKMAQGKSAMLLGEPWYCMEIYKQNPSMELGWFYLPDESGKTCARIIDGKYFGITTECARDEERFSAAVDFLKYYFSPEVYSEVGRQMKFISNQWQKERDLSPIEWSVRESFRKSDLQTSSCISDNVMPINFQNSILMVMMDYLKDEITLEEAMERCEESYWKEYLLEQPED